VAFLDEAKWLPNLILPFVLNRDPFQVEDFIRVLRSTSFMSYRAWFVEVALWGIIGKATGLPIYKLLGGGSGVRRPKGIPSFLMRWRRVPGLIPNMRAAPRGPST